MKQATQLLTAFLISAESRTAKIEGDFVVFIIGAVVHNWWDVRGWLPVFTGMGTMLKELTVLPCPFSLIS